MATAWLGFVLLLALTGACSAQSTCVNSPIPAEPADTEVIGGQMFNVAPNGIVVFPDRDFVTIEGFSKYEGCELLVEVVRKPVGGSPQVVGSATGTVSGTDVAFEINHPGGYCWGHGTGLAVTPNIRAGDLVRLKYQDQVIGETLTSTEVITASPTTIPIDPSDPKTFTTFTIEGDVGPGVDPDFLEQRIIAPDLKNTAVARRDVRAVNGPRTRAAKGGYFSSLTVTGGRFLARYEFDDAATAKLAVAGGARIMAWQRVDPDGNRIALTISEYGEGGGPGLGGCPAGPSDAAAPAGHATALPLATNPANAPAGTIGTMRVDWTPVDAVPDSEPVTGYSVVAIDPTTSVQIGKRTEATGRFVIIAGLAKGVKYTVEVRSIAAKRMSEPFIMDDPVAAATNPDGTTDTTKPVITFTDPTKPTNTVTLTCTPVGDAAIYYTIDGTNAIDGDGPSADAVLYEKPIPITKATIVHYMAVDAAGNFVADLAGEFIPIAAAAPTTKPVPTAPPGSSGGPQQVLLAWTQPVVDPDVFSYQVQLYTKLTPTSPVVEVGPVVDAPQKSLTIGKLNAGQAYYFAVRGVSKAGLWGEWSALSDKLTPTEATDRISITSAKWKTGDFRIIGTGSLTGATVVVRTGSATGTQIPGATTTVTAPVAPATVGDFNIRLRTNVPARNPVTIWVTSDGKGVAGPFSVANGRRRQLS